MKIWPDLFSGVLLIRQDALHPVGIGKQRAVLGAIGGGVQCRVSRVHSATWVLHEAEPTRLGFGDSWRRGMKHDSFLFDIHSRLRIHGQRKLECFAECRLDLAH
jgi:hypothetical protein